MSEEIIKQYSVSDLDKAYLNLTCGNVVAHFPDFYYNAQDLKDLIEHAKVSIEFAAMEIATLSALEKFAIYVILQSVYKK